MQISNTSWTTLSPANPDKIVVQNVGDTRIAFVMAAVAPTGSLENGSHGILHPGSAPLTIIDASVDSLNVYVRSLGPKNGLLYVV